MEPYSISTVIQLYSAGLISRAALEHEASTCQWSTRTSEARANAGRPEESFIDLRPDANGVWRHN